MPPQKRTKDDSFKYMQSVINNNPIMSVINDIDRQISVNLHDSRILTRPVASNGLWCCALIPTILLLYSILYTTSPVYKLVSYISLSLMFYCILYITFMSVSCLVLEDPVYGGCIAPSLMSSLFLYVFLGKDLIASLCYSIPTVFTFSLLLRLSLLKLPKTFSVGEAMLVVQGIVLYAVMTVAKILDEKADEEFDFVTNIVNTVLTTVGIIVTALYLLNDEHRNMRSLYSLIMGAAIFALIMVHSIIGVEFFFILFNYVFMDIVRLKLLTFWIFLVMVTVVILAMRTQLAVKATTVTRKSFHLLASIVFLTGIICDEMLMRLAAGCGLGLIILIEALRKSGIKPVSTFLQSAFDVYSDEKDVGVFAMTPLYLYCGLACPLVLSPVRLDNKLELLSGVLSVGVGDTAASWFGARYGTSKWTGSNKTREGTAFNILAQISTVYALQLFELLDSNHALIRAAFAATVSGLVEATTDQVDNLVLPLITIIAFQVTAVIDYI